MCFRLDVDRVPDALVVGERDGRLSRPVPVVAQPTAAWGLLTTQWDHSFGSPDEFLDPCFSNPTGAGRRKRSPNRCSQMPAHQSAPASLASRITRRLLS